MRSCLIGINEDFGWLKGDSLWSGVYSRKNWLQLKLFKQGRRVFILLLEIYSDYTITVMIMLSLDINILSQSCILVLESIELIKLWFSLLKTAIMCK